MICCCFISAAVNCHFSNAIDSPRLISRQTTPLIICCYFTSAAACLHVLNAVASFPFISRISPFCSVAPSHLLSPAFDGHVSNAPDNARFSILVSAPLVICCCCFISAAASCHFSTPCFSFSVAFAFFSPLRCYLRVTDLH